MAPELPEPEIRRLIRQRFREGSLLVMTRTIPPGVAGLGNHICTVCGFAILAGRNECNVEGAAAHEGCAVIWREESDRAL
jgi:hypothetical protein